MTPEEIQAMKPGEHMDRLIAEKVMRMHITIGEYSGAEYWNDEDDFSPYSVKGFIPSIDISTAWDVVEKISSKENWMLYRIGQTDEDGQIKFECAFLEINRGITGYARAITAPEAICKAALLAVLGRKKGERPTAIRIHQKRVWK
ncbi:hypothetical protein RE628_11390 [Paenibacillus sp. D2_2]|uniref:BC1872 family protein n=1 Tax=Paenibacillus sp. D2_2 TaxID=3073092 RepID=UPI002815EE36|nr:hypothetical protein [Paenibacillus sp. D2_2]WMT42831.1 hypothetical protein RE628_11390 [Paenibacillus sp. D2_2]